MDRSGFRNPTSGGARGGGTWREGHDGIKIIPLAYVVEKLFMKNIWGNRSIARSWAIIWLSYITILLASIVIEIITTFSENIPISRTFDSFGPLWSQIWPDKKMSL